MSFISAILLLGGKGSRFDLTTPKQFFLLKEKPLFLYPLQTLVESNLFQEIILVIPEGSLSFVENWVKPYLDKLKLIQGGNTRQASSYQGILACHPLSEYVVIHDAARAFVSHRILQENVENVQKYKAVNTAIPSTSTIVYTKPCKTFLESIPLREKCFEGQTPQSFSYSIIKKAHEEALINNIEGASDDCRLVLPSHPIKIILGEEKNFKITTKKDIHLASIFLE